METTIQQAAESQLDRLRALADKLDCLTETDVTGPAYILLGNRYLYPRKAVAQYLESATRTRSHQSAKEVLQ